MKYVVLLVGYADGRSWDERSEAEQAQFFETHAGFDAVVEAAEGCRILAGEALNDDGSDATVVINHTDRDPVITAGAFSESTEAIGGFYLLEVPDLSTLLELVKKLPPYTMELRPVIEYEME